MREVAAEKIAGTEPAVGDLVTLVTELAITEADVGQYLAVAAEIAQLQEFLGSEAVRNHKDDWWKHHELATKLKAELDQFKRQHEVRTVQWKSHNDTLERQESDIRRANVTSCG